ncbi:hypothetical protein Tco_0455777 [Tanacetum coccineum]
MARLVRLDELPEAAKGALIGELEKLKCLDVMQSAAFLNDTQRRDVEKATGLLIMVKDTQLRTCEKLSFLRKMRGFEMV